MAIGDEGLEGKKGSGNVYQMRLPSRRSMERQPIVRVCRLLGVNRVKSDGEFLRLVLNGLSITSVQAVINHLEAARDGGGAMTEVVVSRRTLSRRRKQGRQLLTTDESDRLVRLARIVILAEDVFGDRLKAISWLSQSKPPALGAATPISALATETGARLVENMLHQINHGMF